MPLTVEVFSKLVSQSCAKSVENLKEVWIPTCAKIISDKRDEVESWMPYVEVCLQLAS